MFDDWWNVVRSAAETNGTIEQPIITTIAYNDNCRLEDRIEIHF